MQLMRSETRSVGDKVQGLGSGELYKKLSPEALKHFMALATPSMYAANIMLFQEKEVARSIFVVLEGEVKLSINSSDGRRLSLRIARKGDVLGLAAVLAGKTHDMTAETLYPAKLGPIGRNEFLGFLARYPAAYPAFSAELSREYTLACEQLRTVALSASAPEKLARLLLDRSDSRTTEPNGRIRFSLTHEEIGQFIGATRETVTRTLSIFKERHLVSCNGSTLTIADRSALEHYALA